MTKIYGGRWVVRGTLGEGGQAHVFRVQDKRAEHHGDFALKRILNPTRSSRFQNEVEAIKRLQHPNIIRLIDHSAFDGADNERQYLVMPIAEGGDLAHDRRLSLYTDNIDAVLRVSKQIALGLSSAHAAGVIHRDIKPANILSTGNGHDIWISDFGICLLREVERHTGEAEVVGPRSFMAPELEYGGKLEVTPAADIYSLGKLIFFLMTAGTVIPREYVHEEQYAKYLEKSEQHRLLRTLLHKMICLGREPINLQGRRYAKVRYASITDVLLHSSATTLSAKSGCRIPSLELEGDAALQTASPSCGKAIVDERCRQDLMNESRSGLRTSACVVSMPWG